VELFLELLKLAVNIPVDTEVERALAVNFQLMGSGQSVLTSNTDLRAIQSMRNPNHLKAIKDPEFRTELVSDLLLYVSNVLQTATLLDSLSGAGERRGTVRAEFRASLALWIQTVFLPYVRERLPDGKLSPLLAAECDWRGQLQITPPSRGAAAASPGTRGGASMLAAARLRQTPVQTARRLEFEEFQHLPGRCEKCAAECKSARSRFVCSCGAICCKACYGLATSEANDVTGYK
jgi:hypothetical protein